MVQIDGYQIIGIDLHNSENPLDNDFSVIVCMCGKCRNVITSRKYKPGINEVDVPVFIRCPKCGVRFKNHIWNEELQKIKSTMKE